MRRRNFFAIFAGIPAVAVVKQPPSGVEWSGWRTSQNNLRIVGWWYKHLPNRMLRYSVVGSHYGPYVAFHSDDLYIDGTMTLEDAFKRDPTKHLPEDWDRIFAVEKQKALERLLEG